MSITSDVEHIVDDAIKPLKDPINDAKEIIGDVKDVVGDIKDDLGKARDAIDDITGILRTGYDDAKDVFETAKEFGATLLQDAEHLLEPLKQLEKVIENGAESFVGFSEDEGKALRDTLEDDLDAISAAVKGLEDVETVDGPVVQSFLKALLDDIVDLFETIKTVVAAIPEIFFSPFAFLKDHIRMETSANALNSYVSDRKIEFDSSQSVSSQTSSKMAKLARSTDAGKLTQKGDDSASQLDRIEAMLQTLTAPPPKSEQSKKSATAVLKSLQAAMIYGASSTPLSCAIDVNIGAGIMAGLKLAVVSIGPIVFGGVALILGWIIAILDAI